MVKDDYRKDIDDLVEAENSAGKCPLDGLPCEHVDSCDDILSLQFGVSAAEGESCERAKSGKK